MVVTQKRQVFFKQFFFVNVISTVNLATTAHSKTNNWANETKHTLTHV